MRPVSAVSNNSDHHLDHVNFSSNFHRKNFLSIRMNQISNQHEWSNDTLNYSIIFNHSMNVLQINYPMEIISSKAGRLHSSIYFFFLWWKFHLVQQSIQIIVEESTNNYNIGNLSGMGNYLNFKIFSKISHLLRHFPWSILK